MMFLSKLFGCSHSRTTFPMTPGRCIATPPVLGAPRSGTYVVCLDCGKVFAYDWEHMRIGAEIPRASHVQVGELERANG